MVWSRTRTRSIRGTAKRERRQTSDEARKAGHGERDREQAREQAREQERGRERGEYRAQESRRQGSKEISRKEAEGEKGTRSRKSAWEKREKRNADSGFPPPALLTTLDAQRTTATTHYCCDHC